MLCLFSNHYRVSLCLWVALLLAPRAALALGLQVNASELNLRTEAASSGKAVCKLPNGTALTALSAENNGWIKVKAGGACGKEGYVAAKYVAPAASSAPREQGMSNVPLVLTERYNPKKEPARGLNEFTSSLGLLTFGNLYRATALDLDRMIREKLSLPELKAYFPSSRERESIASRLADNIDRNYLKKGMTNDNVIGATRYAAEELLGMVIQRAMAKEGVKDAGRRALWVRKILAPFEGCMKSARTYQEGNKCLDAAQEDAVKNIGLAIGYEMIRQEMGPGYTNGIATPYRKCLNPGKAGANDRVPGCVLNLMRSAAADFGVDKVEDAAAAQAPRSAAAVAKAVRPDFVKCLARASARSGFSRCADDLVAEAGGAIAAAAVENNQQVTEYFSLPKERARLAADSREIFRKCMSANLKAGRRDSAGNLATDNCESRVRLEVARNVGHALIRGNLEKMSDLPAAERKEIELTVGNSLDACWDSLSSEAKNNACLKKTIESLVGKVAEAKIAEQMPPVLSAEDPKLKSRLVSSVQACIRTDLPDDVMNSENAAEKVDVCAAKLLREAALKIAAFELRQALHGKTSDEKAASRLVTKLVDQDFASCLGPAPKDDLLARCTVRLKRASAISAGELLFGEEFDRFVDKNGGAPALGIPPSERDRFLSDLLRRHSACANEKIKDETSADAAVDGCFKDSIQSLALFLGKYSFRKGSRDHVSDPATLAGLTDRFEKSLAACLDEKRGEKYNLNDYVENIDQCADRLTVFFTQKLGEQQVAEALESNLSGPGLASRRSLLQKELVGNFTVCLGKSEEKENREACVKSLEKSATLEIAREAAREQAKDLLNGGPIPKEMAGAEEKLEACIASGKFPDACARLHAANVAKLLGSLKLKVSLGSALGETKYRERASAIASLEKDFFACVDSLPGAKPDAAFLRALKDCGARLEAAGVRLVQENMGEWLESPNASSLEASLRLEAANAIPCLGPLLPSGPVEEAALAALDPEGLLQEVAGVVGDYINYDAQRADQDFDKLLRQVMADLDGAGPAKARRHLLDLLVKEGMVDQLFKSMVRAQVKKSLDALPAEDRLSPELQAVLLDKATLEAALTPEVMARFRPFMAENLLSPLLIEGKTLKDSGPKAAMKQLEKDVAEALLASPAFGERLVQGTLQEQIDHAAGSVSRWFTSSIMGYNYEWAQIRRSETGAAAETYMRDKIIRPMVTGEQVPADEMARRRAEVSRLVKQAVKGG